MADEKNMATPGEEEIEIITLTDENGEDMDFEFLDLIVYEGKRYAVLLPPIEDVEGEDENEDEEVLIRIVYAGVQEEASVLRETIDKTQTDYLITKNEHNMDTYLTDAGCTIVGKSENYTIFCCNRVL